MKIWEENYGADADNNRGELRTYAELEDSDNEIVAEKLYDNFIDGSIDGVSEIEIDGFSFDVSIEDYTEELIKLAKDDKAFENDEDFKQMILDIELDYDIAVAEHLKKKKK